MQHNQQPPTVPVRRGGKTHYININDQKRAQQPDAPATAPNESAHTPSDNLIALLGLALTYLGLAFAFSILPRMDWIDCALYAGMVTVAAVGIVGLLADFFFDADPYSNDFLARPQPGLLLKVEAPRFRLTLETRQMPAMVY